jgi:sulfur carrier protein
MMKKINKVKIRINGKIFNLKPKMTLKDVIIKYRIPLKKVAVELNEKIVNKQQLGKIKIKKFDKIEIVHFIGGG